MRKALTDWKVKVLAGSAVIAIAAGLCWYALEMTEPTPAPTFAQAECAAKFLVFAFGGFVIGACLLFVGLVDALGTRRATPLYFILAAAFVWAIRSLISN